MNEILTSVVYMWDGMDLFCTLSEWCVSLRTYVRTCVCTYVVCVCVGGCVHACVCVPVGAEAK